MISDHLHQRSTLDFRRSSNMSFLKIMGQFIRPRDVYHAYHEDLAHP